jgi:hypothetical protein
MAHCKDIDTYGCVRVSDKRDNSRTVLHGPCLPHNRPALFLDLGACGIRVINLNRQVPKRITQIVRLGIPIVSQLDNRAIFLIFIPNKRKRKLALRIIIATQHFHPEQLGIELDRAVEIADSKHGVKKAHCALQYCVGM